MGTLATKMVNDQLVYYDSAYGWRWLDAFGPNVAKALLGGVAVPMQAANSLAGFVTTLVNASTIAETPDVAGGAILITTAGAEHDGVNFHTLSEPFYFASAWPFYFGVKLQISHATETVLFAGVGLADTNWDTGIPDDGIYFSKPDAGTTCDFIVRQDGASTTTSGVHTFVAATDVTLEFYYDGTTVTAYVNGVEAVSVAVTNANFPNDVLMAPTIDFTTGSGDARTCQIAWMRAIQVQQ